MTVCPGFGVNQRETHTPSSLFCALSFWQTRLCYQKSPHIHEHVWQGKATSVNTFPLLDMLQSPCACVCKSLGIYSCKSIFWCCCAHQPETASSTTTQDGQDSWQDYFNSWMCNLEIISKWSPSSIAIEFRCHSSVGPIEPSCVVTCDGFPPPESRLTSQFDVGFCAFE